MVRGLAPDDPPDWARDALEADDRTGVVVEALADGGVRMGLDRQTAMTLAAQTVAGAARLLQHTGMHPGALKDMVSSPGGTTIAGVAALEERGLRPALMAAVARATDRSRTLGAG